MGTKSQNRMASIRHEQCHLLTAVEGMNENSLSVKVQYKKRWR